LVGRKAVLWTGGSRSHLYRKRKLSGNPTRLKAFEGSDQLRQVSLRRPGKGGEPSSLTRPGRESRCVKNRHVRGFRRKPKRRKHAIDKEGVHRATIFVKRNEVEVGAQLRCVEDDERRNKEKH
jgi:hypothetical protein